MTGGVMRRNTRVVVAAGASVPLGIAAGYMGLVAGLTLIQEVLAGFVDLGQASWTSFLNPTVILGLQSPGGTGGIFDAVVGGPGAPGGTVNRYFVFMITAAVAYGAFALLQVTWRWAREAEDAQ